MAENSRKKRWYFHCLCERGRIYAQTLFCFYNFGDHGRYRAGWTTPRNRDASPVERTDPSESKGLYQQFARDRSGHPNLGRRKQSAANRCCHPHEPCSLPAHFADLSGRERGKFFFRLWNDVCGRTGILRCERGFCIRASLA